MAEPAAQPGRSPGGRSFPRPPPYAWAWFQRSRPVVTEAASRLTGSAPEADFMTWLRREFVRDPFVRDVVIDVVAEVAFHARVPARRPPGATWDRGLVWWAAAIAGTTPAEFESRSPSPAGEELQLFDPSLPEPLPPASSTARPTGPRASAARSAERTRLAAHLRELLATADGDQVPASALRQLLAELEEHDRPPPD